MRRLWRLLADVCYAFGLYGAEGRAMRRAHKDRL